MYKSFSKVQYAHHFQETNMIILPLTERLIYRHIKAEQAIHVPDYGSWRDEYPELAHFPAALLETQQYVMWEDAVLERKTRLLWQRSAKNGIFDWYEARDQVKTAKENAEMGFQDWRLPEIHELQGLLQRSDAYLRAKNTGDFDGEIPDMRIECEDTWVNESVWNDGFLWYWSNTPVKNIAGKAWSLLFRVGMDIPNNIQTQLSVRLVRSLQNKVL